MSNRPNARIRQAKTGMATARPGMAVMRPEVVLPAPRASRVAFYRSERWKQVRGRIQGRGAECAACGRRGRLVVDHLLGHDDERQAERAAALLGVPYTPGWEERFWHGPFVLLCSDNGCHSNKTVEETAGRLTDWIRRWQSGELKDG